MNVRKAQKHMQRATELLNQSQLGFGGTDDHRPITRSQTRKMEEKELQSNDENILNMVSDDIRDNVISNLDTCEDVCNLSKADRSWKETTIYNEKLKKKLSLDLEKHWTLSTACQKCHQREKLRLQSIIRLQSMSEEELKKQDRDNRWNLSESDRALMMDNRALMSDIDITVKITEIDWQKGSFDCVLYKDLNGKFTKLFSQNKKLPEMKIGKQVSVYFLQRNTKNEHCVLFFRVPFICNSSLTWKQIKETMDPKEFPGIEASK